VSVNDIFRRDPEVGDTYRHRNGTVEYEVRGFVDGLIVARRWMPRAKRWEYVTHERYVVHALFVFDNSNVRAVNPGGE